MISKVVIDAILKLYLLVIYLQLLKNANNTMNKPVIEILDFTKDFSAGLKGFKVRAVDHVSFSIRENEVFGLLGPNGCGKSTTMKGILGLFAPSHGKCLINGENPETREARRHIGFLPEAPYFQKFLTGEESISYYAKLSGVPSGKLNKRLDDVFNLVGLEQARKRKVGTYSKGMLQRLGMAQAVIHEPSIVILDEPTAGVDPVGSREIGELVLALKNNGKTVLICSHLLGQIEHLCDRIAIMNKGKLVLEGSVKELLKDQDQKAITVNGCSSNLENKTTQLLKEIGLSNISIAPSQNTLEALYLESIK